MIILTQDRRSIIQGEIFHIFIDCEGTIVAEMYGDKELYNLATYSTPHQAVDVLMDISEHLRDYDLYIMQEDKPPKVERSQTTEEFAKEVGRRVDDAIRRKPEHGQDSK